MGGRAGSTIHKDFVYSKKKSAIESYSALRSGPYVEPSYNAERIYRHYDKTQHVGTKPWTTKIFEEILGPALPPPPPPPEVCGNTKLLCRRWLSLTQPPSEHAVESEHY